MAGFEIGPSKFLKPLLIAPWLTRDGETARAVAEALPHLAAGNWLAAAEPIEYAQRRSPGDGTLTFALAELHLLLGSDGATGMFEFLVAKTGWGEALRRLAASRWIAGDAEAARSALQRALSANAPPEDAEFALMANTISGSSGWCGLDNSGFVVIHADGRACEILLDGRKAAGKKIGKRGIQLADGWSNAGRISVRAGGQDLVGSPIDVRAVTRVEGFVRAGAGGITGWCWLPGEPWRAPQIIVNGREIAADRPVNERGEENPFAEPRGFALSAEECLELGDVLDVTGPHGRRLYGAPLAPRGEMDGAVAATKALAQSLLLSGESAAFVTIHADLRGPAPAHPMPDLATRRVLVVIPVYLGLQVTLECLQSVLAAKTEIEDVLLIVDDSPDGELVDELTELAASGEFELDVQSTNRGFPATANRGLRASAGRDVVLLNSDTLVPPGWIADLRDGLYAANDIGTATPLSNAATIFSYPSVKKANPILDLAATVAIADLAREVNCGVVVDVPTAHGFCMYVRAECLADTGLLRADVFGQGYGEENDFSLRASHLGWRHVAVAGSFVGHREGVSFGAAKKELTKRNLEILNRLHPGYDALIEQWSVAEPLFAARRQMDMQRWRRDQANREAVLIVTHDRGGGVERHVLERVREIEARGLCALVLRPSEKSVAISRGDAMAYPNLSYSIPEESHQLMDFLRGCEIAWAEIHHFLGHDAALIADITTHFPVYDVILHDFAWYCPRITLTSQGDRYCGEPDIQQCVWCVADHGSNLEEEIAPPALHARSLRLLKAARAVIAPSRDTARRYTRRFGITVRNEPWEDESTPLVLQKIQKPAGAIRRVAVVGAISFQKGFDLLLQAARLVSTKKLPLEFVVVGHTSDDDRLLATGVVRITGYYQPQDAVAMIQAQQADFAFLPAQWPETWSYVLTQIWQAGLPVIALDLGAPAERIKARHGGMVVPPHLPLERLVACFLDPGLFRT